MRTKRFGERLNDVFLQCVIDFTESRLNLVKFTHYSSQIKWHILLSVLSLAQSSSVERSSLNLETQMVELVRSFMSKLSARL